WPPASIQLFSTLLQQLSDGLVVVFQHIPHGIAQRAGGIGKARECGCLVLRESAVMHVARLSVRIIAASYCLCRSTMLRITYKLFMSSSVLSVMSACLPYATSLTSIQ